MKIEISIAINALNQAIEADRKSWSYAMDEMTPAQNEALVKLLDICTQEDLNNV